MSDTPPTTKAPPARPPASPAASGKAPQGLVLRGNTELATPEEAERSGQVVLEFESPAAYQLALPVPMRSRYTTYIIFTLFLTLFLVCLLLPIDRVVVGTGQIVSVEQQVGVAALDTGIVRSIRARPGQLVRKGDLLMTLDPTNASAELTLYEDQVASLTQETRRLQAEIDGRVYLSDGTRHGELQATLYTQRHAEITYQLENYRQKIDALRAPVMQAQSDIRAYTERLALARTVEDKRRELQRLQVGSELNTLSAADTRAEMTRFLAAANASLEQTQRSLEAMIAERDGFLEQWRSTTGQSLKDQGDKLDQSISSLQKARLSMSMVELRAPMDSIVLNVAPSNSGTVVTTGTQLMQLVPIDAPLEAEVLFAASDAGFVQPGERATIKFDTFPFITHGSATGKVRVLSPDSFREPFNPMTAPAGITSAQQQVGELYYKGRVTLEKLALTAVPEGFRPTPGMQITVDVLAGHRTFLEYMFARVIPATTEAFREP